VLASRLLAEGAEVVAYDPIAMDNARDILPAVTFASSPLKALECADALVLVTEWPEFTELDWPTVLRTMRHPLIIDGRNVLPGTELVQLGFAYEGIGTKIIG